jgi:hypothetical protein
MNCTKNMGLKESVAKAQLQLLGIQSEIKAEGWDKDPDWVTRGKDGKFGGKDSSDREELNKKLQDLQIEKLQASYELLTKQAKEVYANTMNSENAIKVHNYISVGLSNFSVADVGKLYRQAIEQCKKVEPKDWINTVNEVMIRHPLELEVAATILGILTGLCLAGTAISASEALITAAVFSVKTVAKQETKLTALATAKVVKSSVDSAIKTGVVGIVISQTSLEVSNKVIEGRKRKESINKIINKLKLKSLLKEKQKEQANKLAELIYDTYTDTSKRINDGLKLLDKILEK